MDSIVQLFVPELSLRPHKDLTFPFELIILWLCSISCCSVVQLLTCIQLCNPMDWSMPHSSLLYYLLTCLLAQPLSHVWLFCNPMDCRLPGCSVHGIFLARILEWLAISYSRGSFWPRDWNPVSCTSGIGRQVLHHCTTWEAFTISQSLLKFISIESVTLSNNLIFCCPLLLLPSIFPSIRVFSNELALHIRWPKNWSVTFNISPFHRW